MLKLIKYEFFASLQILGAIFAGTIAIVAVSVLSTLVKVPFLQQALLFAGALAPALALTGTLVYLLFRYYTTMFGAQGYLTHTLAVSSTKIYWAKLLYLLAATLFALCLALASWMILFYTHTDSKLWDRIFDQVRFTFSIIGPGVTPLLVVTLLVAFLGQSVVMWSAGLSLGASSIFAARPSIQGPIISIALLYITSQILSLLTIALFPLSLELGENIHLSWKFGIVEMFKNANTPQQATLIPLGIVVAIFVIYPVMALLGQWAVSRKLFLR